MFTALQSWLCFTVRSPTVKINSTSIKGSIPRPGSVTRSSQGGKSGSVQATSPASSVELSSTARHLATLANNENNINPVRVNEIRAALADGTLKIDAERIADGLIESARELLQS